MKKFLRIMIFVFPLLLFGCDGRIYIPMVNPPDLSGEGGSPGGEHVDDKIVPAPDIFVAGDGYYPRYRIPSIVKTKSGTLLAFCEARAGFSDTGNIDLVVRRSTDGGETWSGMIVVWNDGDNTCGNPAPVVDMETGRIHLPMTWNNGLDDIGDINKRTSIDTRRVWYTYSDDDGLTWEDPVEITSSAKLPTSTWYATGPCHSIILKQEAYKGRIVVPCDCTDNGTGYSHIIYSDDKGKTWQIGGMVSGGNECTIEELQDGRLLLNMRNGSGYRKQSYSSDGGVNWTAPVEILTLPDPTCQGSMLHTTVNGNSALIFSNCASSTSRTMVTVKMSLDSGVTFNTGYTVWEGRGAYSDIVMVDDNTIGLLYENGSSNSYEKISFKKIPLSYVL